MSSKMPNLIDSRHQIVELLQRLASLSECSDDNRDDKLTGNQLTKRELTANDKPTTQPQKRRRGQDLEANGKCYLSNHNTKLALASL